jgi:hypothetical protein
MKANFNNQEAEFNIRREHVPYLEHSLGRGLYSVLKDATEGQWTFNDIATVVSFALHGPGHDDRTVIGIARSAARMGFPAPYSIRYRPHPDVVATLEKEGHGNFAGLMADILTEVIFGETPASDSYGNEVPGAAAA